MNHAKKVACATLIGTLFAAALFVTALAQGAIRTSPIAVGGAFPYIGGPTSSEVPANGGTFTCTGGGVITVTNSNVTANSVVLLGLKTAGGTPANPIMTTVTVGTGFTTTCGGSDTSVYNYIILG